ncbi:MAG TPA: hypothetical protein DD706_08600 [Nitrospiraceae bacterium]|nr:hypothetical protein [Nitrospiraceae bacterium]
MCLWHLRKNKSKSTVEKESIARSLTRYQSPIQYRRQQEPLEFFHMIQRTKFLKLAEKMVLEILRQKENWPQIFELCPSQWARAEATFRIILP